eukprot:3026654-Pyramimonas_sp.AAC.1
MADCMADAHAGGSWPIAPVGSPTARALLAAPRIQQAPLGAFLGHSCAVLGGSGAVSGLSWAILGHSWGTLGRLGAVWGASWAVL